MNKSVVMQMRNRVKKFNFPSRAQIVAKKNVHPSKQNSFYNIQ